jgi:hypothetical protein
MEDQNTRLFQGKTPGRELLSPAGAKIVSAFQEAIDVMRSGEPLPGRLTVRSHHAEFVRPLYAPRMCAGCATSWA